MKANKIIVFLFFVFLTNNVFSQLKEFVVTKVDNPQVFYKSKGCTPEDGVLVFYTAISDLEITMPDNPGRLKNVPAFDPKNNCYVLCVQPTDKTLGGISQYNISISGDKFKPMPAYPVGNIKAGETQYFRIDPKESEQVQEEKLKREEAERKAEQKEQQRIASEKKANEERRQREEAEKRADKIRPRKPLIEDWSKDFKTIAGLSNGIVAGEIVGLYGEIKFGERTGFALEGGYGIGIGDSDIERWSLGVKGLYKNWFLSGHYGTTMNIGNKNAEFSMNDDGSFILSGSRTGGRHGTTLLGGYDRTFGWVHLTIGVGGTATTLVNSKFLLAWNMGIGISLGDLVK